MEVLSGFPAQPMTRPVFLTIGNFDGVHRGHQSLVVEMVKAARAAGGQAGLLTFDPHPLKVLRPDVPLSYLTTIEERAALLAPLDLDFMLVLPFTRETASTSAADFMRHVRRHMELRELWVGPDFALGRGREGNVTRLAELGESLGYRAHVVTPFDWQGEPVRSSRVRSLLAQQGDVARAGALLGRAYQIWGRVERGAQRGRSLGFPTANLAVPAERLVPAFGIYACWAWRSDRGYPAVTSIGVRPTFDNGARTVEAYLLDFSEDLYGETLGLSFIERLREEKRFPSAEALVAQMHADVANARRALASTPDHTPPSGETEFWREIPHSADWAIEVDASSQGQLFARAAAAMYRLQDADFARPVTLAHAFRLTEETMPGMLVSWLNRLLLEQETNGEMYTRFEIEEISASGLRAIVYGHPGTPTHTAIKAVTYYDLVAEPTPSGWTARVTFDV